MAYTYDDVVAAAKNAGVLDRLSEKDLAVAQTNPEYGISLTGLLKDISAATTEEQRLLATEAANQMRKSYGVYAANDSDSGGTFASSDRSDIDRVLDDMVNQGSFSYDPETDPTYSAVKKTYLREGERASANALAQAAAATGGRPSSFAVTAATQAGNYYAGQLADQIPTLRQNAYSEYLQDFANKQNVLTALQGQDAIDYERYLTGINQDQAAKENALALFEMLGYATPEIAATLGIPVETTVSKAGTTTLTAPTTPTTPTTPNENTVPTFVPQAAAGPNVTAGTVESVNPALLSNQGNDDNTLVRVQGGNGVPGEVGPTVINQNDPDGDSGWIVVGDKKLTWQQLLDKVSTGEIIERVDEARGEVYYYWKPTFSGEVGGGGKISYKQVYD